MKVPDFERLAERVRNWGRWGAADQRGTLNHITPEALKRAAGSVRQGKLFNLGLDFNANGPQTGQGKRFNPKLYAVDLFAPINPTRPDVCFSDDVIHMPLQCATQWDAFAHVHYGGQLYNGAKAAEAFSVSGTSHCGIDHLARPGIMSRGVLLDIARLRGADILPRDYAITVDDLRAACDKQNVTLEPGDILLVRTGQIRRFTETGDRAGFGGLQPGLDATCAEWVYERSIAAVAADNLAVEVITEELHNPNLPRDVMPLPFHMLMLRDMGCPLGEIFNLEALAADCAADGQYAFQLAAPPLAVTGAFGSPINPLALK
ncbi:MAG: cyclase family protein [Caulobacteraceae bacterium]|nr:cyclase family protein [Caulobacteraceae bacterium]